MKMLRKIKSVILWIAVLGLMLVCAESFLRISGGKTPVPPDNAYLHIYEPFFSRVAVPGKGTMLKCMRFIGRQDNQIEPFYEKKPSNTVRIFIVGGSVAEGMNISGLSQLLDETSDDKAFEIINCGYGGSESFGEKRIVSEILGYSPDLIILFSGNNEYYDTNGYNHRLVAINRYLRSFRLWCRFQDALSSRFPSLGKAPARSREQRYKDFEDNIAGIAMQAKEAGVGLVLCTMPANIHDDAPIGLLPVWNENFVRAYLYLELDRAGEALALFKRLEGELEENPFVYYFAARAAEKLEDFEAARKLYVQAQEYDFPHNRETRATATINNIIRRLCVGSGAVLADLDASCSSVSEHGITGLDLLVDSCHWRRKTEEIVRKTILKALADAGSPVWPIKYASGQLDIVGPAINRAEEIEKDTGELLSRMELLFDLIKKNDRSIWYQWATLFDDLFLVVYRMFDIAETEACHECLVSGLEWFFKRYPEVFAAFDSFYRRCFMLWAEDDELSHEKQFGAIRIMLYARACRRVGLVDRAVSSLSFVLEHFQPMPRWLEAQICVDLALAYFSLDRKEKTFNCLDRAQVLGADVKVLRKVLDSF